MYHVACPTKSLLTSSPSFYVGETLRCSRDGFTSLCRVVSLDQLDDPAPLITIKLTCGRVLDASTTFLQHPLDPDIACVPIDKDDYSRELPNLHSDDLSFLTNPSPSSSDDEEWLRHHYALNHLSRHAMYNLASAGVLPKKFLKYKTTSPFCASCTFGKAHRRQWRHKGPKSSHIRHSDDNIPGACVSSDQLVSAQPGLIPQISGRLTSSRIHCATLFVDHASSFVYSFLQRSTSQVDTLDAKAAFEKFASSCDVVIQKYHTDNGRYAEAAFRADCSDNNQSQSFCAVGAHHQNGIAEAHIKKFTLAARTTLLHAKRHWPEAITTMLWPFALQYVVKIHNTFHLDDEFISPHMKFTGISSLPSGYDFHPFGCPVFVLESKLQSDSKGLPKWDPRARLGIFLGHSPLHAGSVALVLNPATGHVSPQYHLVFDDTFSTVSSMRTGTVPANWRQLVETSSFCSTDQNYDLNDIWFQESTLDDDNPDSAVPLLPGPTLPLGTTSDDLFGSAAPSSVATSSVPSASEGESLVSADSSPASEGDDIPPSSSPAPPLASEGDASVPAHPSVDFEPTLPSSPVCEGDPTPHSGPSVDPGLVPSFTNLESAGLRRSNRKRTPHSKVADSYDKSFRKLHSLFTKMQFVGLTCLATVVATTCSTLSATNAPFTHSGSVCPSSFATSVDLFHRVNSHFDSSLNVLSTFA